MRGSGIRGDKRSKTDADPTVPAPPYLLSARRMTLQSPPTSRAPRPPPPPPPPPPPGHRPPTRLACYGGPSRAMAISRDPSPSHNRHEPSHLQPRTNPTRARPAAFKPPNPPIRGMAGHSTARDGAVARPRGRRV